MVEKIFSEEAQWFLESVKKINEDFSKQIGMLDVLVDREGKVVFMNNPAMEICKFVQKTKEGARRCGVCYKQAVDDFVSGKIKEPHFLNCHANFAVMICPVLSKGEIVGAVIGCGGVFDEESKQKAKQLLSQIEGLNEEMIESVNVINPISQTVLAQKGQRMTKLVGVLAEETAFNEVLG
ncbi:MAG: PocR ligand-binding domain-containing protein [bacterium]|nr:PocR ligand-binding domain-containing protein [bacterium]